MIKSFVVSKGRQSTWCDPLSCGCRCYWRSITGGSLRQGYPLIKSENFRKKSRIVPKKTQRGEGPFGLTCCTFGSIKILWFSARIEPPLSGFRNLVEDEQQNR